MRAQAHLSAIYAWVIVFFSVLMGKYDTLLRDL